MLDAVESELPGHVEDMEFQVSFSGLRCATAVLEQPEKVDSCGWIGRGPAGPDHPDVQLGRNVSQLYGQSQDEMGTLTTRL